MAGPINRRFLNFIFSKPSDTMEFDPRRQPEVAGRLTDGFSGRGLRDETSPNNMMEYLKVTQDLQKRYMDYENMDDDPYISYAYNFYADDITQKDFRTGRTLWVESPDDVVAAGMNAFLAKTLKLERHIWEIARTSCKYGNDLEVILYNSEGVAGLDFVSPALVRRHEWDGGVGFSVNNKGFFNASDRDVIENVRKGVRFANDTFFFDNWEMMHVRLRTKNRGSRYGFSIGESARWPWKRLIMLEDATMLAVVTRTPNRLAYYVRTGNRPGMEALDYLKKIQDLYRKKKFINPTTGKMEMKQSPLSQQDDIWIPLQDGKDPSRVEALPSFENTNMAPLDYFRGRVFAALGIPKQFLAFDETMTVDRVLSNQDIRFARGILRIQREIMYGINKVITVDQALRGVNADNLDYVLKMAVPSTAFEIAMLEVETTKIALAAQYKEFVSNEWVLSRVLGLSDTEVRLILAQKKREEGGGGAPAKEKSEEAKAAEKLKKQQDLMEKKMDRNFNDIMRSEVVNNAKFVEFKGLLNEIKNHVVGIRTREMYRKNGDLNTEMMREELNVDDFVAH
jgi:hypothetical protein